MKVVRPIQTTDAILTSTTIAEPDSGETEWSAGTYNLGDIRIQSVTHRKYRVVSDPSTTIEPKVGVLTTPASWVDIGPTNAWAMFDDENGTQSTETSSLVVELTPSKPFNSVSGFNITGATSIVVIVTDPTEGVVYTKSIDMIDNSNVTGWYMYYFSPIVNITRFILLDLPAYLSGVIKITIVGSADIGVGTIVYGAQSELGVALYGTSWQALDFSVKERDEFGSYTITRRRSSDLLDYDCYLETSKFGYVKNQLASLSTIPTVWVGNENDINDGTAVFGYYKDSQINISSPQIMDMTIQVEGLI